MLMNTLYAEEPKTFQDFINNWERYSDQTESPFVYRIVKHPKQLQCQKILTQSGTVNKAGPIDSPFFCYLLSDNNVSLCIETVVVPSCYWAKITMLRSICNDANNVIFFYHTQDGISTWRGYKTQPGISRFFLSVKHENVLIGNFSFDKRYGGFEGHRICEINFIRGNTIVTIFRPLSHIPFTTLQKQNTNLPEYSVTDMYLPILYDADLPDNPNPCEIAWRIDQYLKGDPLETINDTEKQKLKTLEITLPKDITFEQGKEYPLDFPRKLLDGTVPAEIRLVVSRGEIQQIIEPVTDTANDKTPFPNPASLSPDVNGQYTVLFGQPEKQTIHCYHIDEEGKCLAWGEIEVLVKKTEKQKTE
jgi:hypothetical protein